MIRISGRPRRNWTCTARQQDGTLTVRLDDRDDPEFWTEIVLSEGDNHYHHLEDMRAILADFAGAPIASVVIEDSADKVTVWIEQPGRDKGPGEPSDN